jgi:NitT/TauT family transport system substrate-binding protein
VAEAEHGGFFQALADGTYKKYGLDVTIVPGGPNENNRILLISVGKLDFFMSANTLQSFDAVANNIPTGGGRGHVPEGSAGADDPSGIQNDQAGRSQAADAVRVQGGMASYFQWLKAEYGFSEEKSKPYTFNAQPFLADKQSAMQGYVTSEPFAIEKKAIQAGRHSCWPITASTATRP